MKLDSEIHEDVGFGDVGFCVRDYQHDCDEAVEAGWSMAKRQLIVLSGGLGKTVLAGIISRRFIARNVRVLFLAHRDELLEQAMDKFHRGCGIECDKEKGAERASLESPVVMASIQTLCRTERLTCFPDDHFGLVIVDEAHRGLADQHLKVIRYFHFGKESLEEGWKQPEPDEPYIAKSCLLGLTATPSRADKRSLGEIFQRVAFDYGLLQAVQNGYLVRPIVETIPVSIDLRGIRLANSAEGRDLAAGEVAQRISPVIKEIAKQIAARAMNKKTIIFMPSVETARMMAEECEALGMAAEHVSGNDPKREEKVAWFRIASKGSLLANAQLLGEGVDIPDIDCVSVLRATTIWSFYTQCLLRGTRPLTGILEGLMSSEDRLAAIAGSAKPSFTVLDFLFLTERIDLIRPVDIVATKPEVRQKMIESGEPDLIAAEEKAERDLLKTLEEEAHKHSRRKGAIVDPLALSVSLGDAALATYEPQGAWDSLPAHPSQIAFLKDNGYETPPNLCRGLADKVIDRINTRQKLNLASPKQLAFLTQLGMSEHEAALLSKGRAGVMIQVMRRRKFKR